LISWSSSSSCGVGIMTFFFGFDLLLEGALLG
jgi:hypothetical protein